MHAVGCRTTTRSRCSATSSPFLQQPSSSPPPRRRPAATTSSTALHRTERSTVRAALNASSFDWNVVPKQVTVHVGRYGISHCDSGPRLARPRPARLRPLRLGDGHGRVRAPGRLLRPRSRPPRTAPAAARRQRLVLRGLGPRTRRPRLRAVRLDGRVGVLALEGQRLPPRLAPQTSPPRCRPAEFRALLSTVVGMPTPVSALISGLRRSATAAAPSQPPGCACPRRAWPWPCARASAPSRAR